MIYNASNESNFDYFSFRLVLQGSLPSSKALTLFHQFFFFPKFLASSVRVSILHAYLIPKVLLIEVFLAHPGSRFRKYPEHLERAMMSRVADFARANSPSSFTPIFVLPETIHENISENIHESIYENILPE